MNFLHTSSLRLGLQTTRNHFNVEGTIEFSGILFVPGMAPFEQVRSRCRCPPTHPPYLVAMVFLLL